MQNTEFNRLKLLLDTLYFPLSGGRINGKTIFSKTVQFLNTDKKKKVSIQNGMIEGANVSYFGICDAEQGAKQFKSVKIQGVEDFALRVGTSIAVKFATTNSFPATQAAPIALDVNGTGVKNIYYDTGIPTGTDVIAFGKANTTNLYMYDGTYWVFVGSGSGSGGGGSEVSVTPASAINGPTIATITVDGTSNTIKAPANIEQGFSYCTCTTAAATAAKTASSTESGSFVLRTGGFVAVRFRYAVGASATLNIESTGAKEIRYATATSYSAITDGMIPAASTALFCYNGSYYVLVAVNTAGFAPMSSYVGMIIQSTTLNTQAKVIAQYGGTTWIRHTGYVLRGASSSVTANQASNDGGADSVTVSSVASHNHTQNAHDHTFGGNSDAGIVGNNIYYSEYGASKTIHYGKIATHPYGRVGTGAGATDNTTATNNAKGSNYTVNTLPKYKNVYIWERTA